MACQVHGHRRAALLVADCVLLLVVLSVAVLASGAMLHRPRSVWMLFLSLAHLLQLKATAQAYTPCKGTRSVAEPLQ